jgi:hypothetical protein
MLHACSLLFIMCLCMSVKSSTELMLYVVLTMPTLNKAYLFIYYYLFIYLLLLTMDAYHNIYLLRTVDIASTYNERLPWHLLTIDGYHNNYLQWKVTIYILPTMDSYHNIYPR